MINTFVHLMIQKIKKFLECQTLPENILGCPNFRRDSSKFYKWEGDRPPCTPASYAYGYAVYVFVTC